MPVNWTRRSLLHGEWENGWQSTQLISVVSGIAGLFHDLGKANDLFQDKLVATIHTLRFEPYRHEWVSLRLFEAFVNNSNNDTSWLKRLMDLEVKKDNVNILDHLTIDSPEDSIS